jgi:hypothetical protein
MKGFVARLALAAGLLGGLMGLNGCYGYKDLVDPCYPWRYTWSAQQTVCEARGTQVNNGHILDQTLFNDPSTGRSLHFDYGKATLTKQGMDKLDQIVHRRPHADPVIYIATARDIPYTPDMKPEDYGKRRSDLDNARKAAVLHYLAAVTSGRNQPFQVVVGGAEHDPVVPGLNAAPLMRSMTSMEAGYTGALGGGAAPK